MQNGERHLAAIMFTDIVGYTSLTQENESATIGLLEEHRKLVRPIFAGHGGREIKTMGDAFLVEFGSALDATLCAVAVQSSMNDRRLSRRDNFAIRIGVHLGDVIEKENDMLGDAVNIASRVQQLAKPGGICITQQVYDQVKNKVPYLLLKAPGRELKNIRELVDVYEVVLPWEHPAEQETPSLQRNRIAILPFASFSSDPEDAYFADGMTDEVISAAAGVSGLSVISRTSVMLYKGTTKKIEEIGRELKVGSILEGTFKKAGSKIRVTTQLIDVATDEHLWTQNYDRNLDDVLEVQSDIAKHVAEALSVRILSSENERMEKKLTENTTAYALYLKGRFHWNKRSVEELTRAMEYFDLAVHEDSGFALGYVGQADCAFVLRWNWDYDREANLEKARKASTKALELDPGLAEAHSSKGDLLFQEYRIRESEEEFKKAIQLKPSYARAHQMYSHNLASQLRWEESFEHIERALELDPLSPIINMNYGDHFVNTKEYDRAIDPYKKAVELGYDSAHGSLFDAYGRMKMFDEMSREGSLWVESLRDSIPMAKAIIDAKIAYYEGDRSTLKRLLPNLVAHFQDRGIGAGQIAAAHFYLGENDKGFEWLELSYSRREPFMVYVAFNPDLDRIRNDPRYLDILKRLGMQ